MLPAVGDAGDRGGQAGDGGSSDAAKGVMDTLHDPEEAHIIELEKYVEFAFEHDGQRHTLSREDRPC